jgi:acetylglutamate kinase
MAAGAIAGALKARKLLMLTDVRGVLDGNKQFLPTLSDAEARRLVREGTISGGMIPKIETCLDAVARGVDAAVILDGRVPHAILLELFTEHGFGTQVVAANREVHP